MPRPIARLIQEQEAIRGRLLQRLRVQVIPPRPLLGV